MSDWQVIQGDCLDVLRGMAANSIDAIVTDPPYGLSFMGKKWDYDVPAVGVWAECLRVLKPGGHLLAFAGTRTQHRMAVRIEDAGFEIRDMIAWVYATGFPKSHNLDGDWSGWGTALKPALEPITMARKPFASTVAANVAQWGTGAINVDGCRVAGDVPSVHATRKTDYPQTYTGDGVGWGQSRGGKAGDVVSFDPHALGRWPANLIHDGSDEVVGGFPQAGGGFGTRGKLNGGATEWGFDGHGQTVGYGDSGSAARFFFVPKNDTICSICYMPCNAKHDTMTACTPTHASNAGKNGTTSQATAESFAPWRATQPPNASLVHSVKCAGNLCDLCATRIAVALAEQRTAPDPERNHGWDFISERKRQILTRCLASFAVLLGNTDTIPTMQSLSLFFGCVRDAMQSNIQTAATVSDFDHQRRLFYSPKASKAERDAGCEGLPYGDPPASARSVPAEGRSNALGEPRRNHHPTVKPAALMAYLCRLVTPPGGTVLDPFNGSGSTGIGAIREGFNYIGIEREAEYVEIASKRIGHEAANHLYQGTP